jgi:hypothetical protein
MQVSSAAAGGGGVVGWWLGLDMRPSGELSCALCGGVVVCDGGWHGGAGVSGLTHPCLLVELCVYSMSIWPSLLLMCWLIEKVMVVVVVVVVETTLVKPGEMT